MKIFLSYASEDKDIAEQLYLILVKAQHRVFFDRKDLPAGDDYNTRIQKAVNNSDLFVFLISPDSVSKTSYALTEYNLAREKWTHPEGHVLPVMVRKTDYQEIPPYLRAVAILEPEGNTAVEVSRRIATWRHNADKRVRIVSIALVLLMCLIASILFYRQYFSKPTPVPVPETHTVADKNKGGGTVTVIYLKRAEPEVVSLVNTLKEQGYAASATRRKISEPAPSNPEVRWYYLEDRERAKDIRATIAQTLKILPEFNPPEDTLPSARGHSKGEIRVYLD